MHALAPVIVGRNAVRAEQVARHLKMDFRNCYRDALKICNSLQRTDVRVPGGMGNQIGYYCMRVAGLYALE